MIHWNDTLIRARCRLDVWHIWWLRWSVLLLWRHLLSCGLFDVFRPADVATIQQGKQSEIREPVKDEKTKSSLRGDAGFIWMFMERPAWVQDIKQCTVQRYYNNRTSGKCLKGKQARSQLCSLLCFLAFAATKTAGNYIVHWKIKRIINIRGRLKKCFFLWTRPIPFPRLSSTLLRL